MSTACDFMVLTQTKCGSKQRPNQIAIDPANKLLSSDENATNTPRMAPLPKIVAITVGKIAKNDAPYLLLGTNVIGPFFKNRVIPKQHEKRLNKKVAMNWKLLFASARVLSNWSMAIPQLLI